MSDMPQIIASVEDAIVIVEKEAYRTIANGLREALAILKEQPEIVRCKECKHRLECDYWIENGDDWFCADGKRQEGR